MSRWLLFIIGFAAFPVVVIAAKIGWIAATEFLARRSRRAAGYLLQAMEYGLSKGKRISFRPLITTPEVRGRSWALVLFKQGPKEPIAGRPANPPFTESLDDEGSAVE